MTSTSMSSTYINTEKYEKYRDRTQYDEYFNMVINDLTEFVCHSIPNLFMNALNVQHCPLRSPLQLEPHHVKNATFLKEQSLVHLQQMLDEMVEFRDRLTLEQNQMPPEQDDPSLKKLVEYAAQNEKKNAYASRLVKNIVLLVDSIQQNCHQMWDQIKLMNQDITKVLDQQVRIIATEIVNIHQRLCPELAQLIVKRKELEQKMHDKNREDCKQQAEERRQFYAIVWEFMNSQLEIIRHMLVITRSVIEQYSNETTKAADLRRYQGFENSLNTLRDLLASDIKKDIPCPILRSNLSQLQGWLIGYQKFFLEVISHIDITEQQVRDMLGSSATNFGGRPLPLSMLSTLEDEQDKLIASGNTETTRPKHLPPAPTISGIIDLDPKIYHFYQTSIPIQNKMLQSSEKAQQELMHRHQELQRKRNAIETNMTENLTHSNLDKAFKNRGSPSADVNTYKTNQLMLHQNLIDIQNAQELVAKALKRLTPKLENQRALVKSLNEIIHALNFISPMYANRWQQLIDQEHKLCVEGWMRSRNEYHEQYLNFRAQTRTMLGRLVIKMETELSASLAHALGNIRLSHIEDMKKLGEQAEIYSTANYKNRKTIEIEFTALQDLTRSNNLATRNINEEIAYVLSQWESKIAAQDLRNFYEYNLKTQQALILFTETLKVTLNDMFNCDKSNCITSYLQKLDVMCCTDNQDGTAPMPRCSPNNDSLVPSSETWIQLLDYPAEIMPQKLLSKSEYARNLAKRNHFVTEPEAIQKQSTDLKNYITKYREEHPM